MHMSTRKTGGILGRRGVMAGAAALLGAGLARLGGTRPVEAGHNTNIAYDTQTVMHLDVTNTSAGSSRISSNISGTAAAVVLNNYPVGISRPDGFLGRTMYTTSNCAGVAGACEAAANGIGVMGTAKAATGTGVYAYSGSVVPSTAAPAGTGAYASGPNYGIFAVGRTGTSIGVSGSSDAGSGVSGVANTGVGVAGTSNTNYGVYGRGGGAQASIYGDGANSSGPGVYGISTSSAGVLGVSDTTFGVYGQTTTGSAILGQALGAGLAGNFLGDVSITGSLTVTGSFPKSAGVPHPDGTIRRMYCMEGPESVFEDWGQGTLKGGQATIKLDGDFAALITTDAYSVFAVPEGDCNGLFIGKKSRDAFEVRELAGGSSDVPFSYRILARRKDLVGKTQRLETITLPTGVVRGGYHGVVTDGAKLPKRPTAPNVTLPSKADLAQQPVPGFAAADEPVR